MSSNPPVSKLLIDQKYDKLIDLSLRRTVYGILAGGLAGLLLLRGPYSRTAAVAFGAGVGLGSAWQQCSKEFEDLVPSMLHPAHVKEKQ